MGPLPLNERNKDPAEIHLRHKTHPPSRAAITAAILMVAVLTLLGAIEATQSVPAAIAISVAVFVLGLWSFPALYYWKTNQLGVPTELVADGTKVTGYVQWPPIWPNSFFELPKTFSWQEVRAVGIRPVPYVYALSNIQLELTLKNGRSRTLRLPHITDAQYIDFANELRRIADNVGFSFAVEPPLGPPRL